MKWLLVFNKPIGSVEVGKWKNDIFGCFELELLIVVLIGYLDSDFKTDMLWLGFIVCGFEKTDILRGRIFKKKHKSYCYRFTENRYAVI